MLIPNQSASVIQLVHVPKLNPPKIYSGLSNNRMFGASTEPDCMTKNGIALSVIAVLLAAVYVYAFTDWFRSETIQIIPTIRPGRVSAVPRDPDQAAVYPVSFAFSGKYKLTSVKVLAADDLATNKFPTPLWHLVPEISNSNSVPVKSIVYGYPVKGMKPAVARMQPEPLSPDVDYVLQIEAGSIKSQTNFHTAKAVAPAK